MKTILAYFLTPFFYLYFGLLLVLFHPFQVVAHRVFGERARQGVVDFLNFFLIRGLYIMGTRIKFLGFEKIPANGPVIIVSNHQSMYDIPVIIYRFRKYYPKFISKIELGKNLPSISYNLKHGDSALIDRKKGSQAVREIYKLGRLIEEQKCAACIFPEGTRSKTGKLRKFKVAGIDALVRAAPSAMIVPFVIDGHSKIISKGVYPLMFGQKVTYTVLDPVDPKSKPMDDLVPYIQGLIQKSLDKSSEAKNQGI